MKTIISLSMLFFVGLAYFANAEENGNESKVEQNASEEKVIPEQKDALNKFKIDIYPTSSLLCNLRATPFIAGESLSFSARLSALDEKEDFDCSVLHELYNSEGILVHLLPEVKINRKTAQFGHSTFAENFWINLEDPKPGKYRLKILIVDHASGNSDSKEHSFEILDRDSFGALNVGFSSMPDRPMPTSGNFAIGEPKFLFCWINGAGVKDDRIHIKSKVIILDAKKQPIDAEPLLADTYKPAPRSRRDHPNLFFAIRPDVPGEYFLRLEITDCVADKTATYDMPIKVSLPPGMDE
jgi:hypothetical protein